MAHTNFFGLTLVTAPGRVMTPRCATERLVAESLARIGDRPARVVDVGTGSGAVAIAIASAAPRARVWATDTSGCAVTLANSNVERHGLDERVTVACCDLVDAVPGDLDLVVANLPYLPAGEAPLRPELAGEPRTAVFADGDGLGPYRRLLAACEERLADDGSVVLQLHREVLAGTRAELPALRAHVEAHAAQHAAARIAA
jgi:release factor glutamine methyltransferase